MRSMLGARQIAIIAKSSPQMHIQETGNKALDARNWGRFTSSSRCATLWGKPGLSKRVKWMSTDCNTWRECAAVQGLLHTSRLSPTIELDFEGTGESLSGSHRTGAPDTQASEHCSPALARFKRDQPHTISYS